MPGIVCAIRGGPNSQPTISKAISLAKDKGLTVYFLYILNLDFLTYTQTSRVSTLTVEMKDLGEFILLSAGSAMGGNGSLIGASANMVTAGISEAAGFRISYGYFLKKGFPALLITVSLATIWLLIRFA